MDPIKTPVPPVPYAGPILIGSLLTYLLFGVLLSQLAHYVQTVAATEPLTLRLLVCLVMVIDCLLLGFTTQNTWQVVVEAYTDPMKMVVQSSISPGIGILNASVALAVEGFFAWRIYSLTTDKKINEWFSLSVEAKFLAILPFVIFLLALLQFAAAICMTIEYVRIGRRVQDVYKIMSPIVIHLSSEMACDILITLGMVHRLAKFRTATKLKRTKSMLNKLVIHTVENGLITTLCATGTLVLCLAARSMSNTISLALHYVIGLLYGIVLLTTLNRRQNYRQLDNGDVTFELNLPPTDMLDSTTVDSQARKLQETGTRRASIVVAARGGPLSTVQVSLQRIVESDTDLKP